MATYNLYVGSNNETGKLELDKTENILNAHFDGFTLQTGIGYWHGGREDTAIITIAGTSEAVVLNVVSKLKRELNQEAIGVQLVADVDFL